MRSLPRLDRSSCSGYCSCSWRRRRGAMWTNAWRPTWNRRPNRLWPRRSSMRSSHLAECLRRRPEIRRRPWKPLPCLPRTTKKVRKRNCRWKIHRRRIRCCRHYSIERIRCRSCGHHHGRNLREIRASVARSATRIVPRRSCRSDESFARCCLPRPCPYATQALLSHFPLPAPAVPAAMPRRPPRERRRGARSKDLAGSEASAVPAAWEAVWAPAADAG